MQIEVKIPSPGESITEVELAEWLVSNGDYIEKDQEIAEIESEKATLPLIAEDSGKIEILVEEGSTLNVGDVACKIDTDAKGESKSGGEQDKTGGSKEEEKTAGQRETVESEKETEKQEISQQEGEEKEKKKEEPAVEKKGEKKTGKGKGRSTAAEEKAEDDRIKEDEASKAGDKDSKEEGETTKEEKQDATDQVKVTPVAKNIIDANNLSVDDIIAGLRKISKKEVEAVLQYQRENGDGGYTQQSGKSYKGKEEPAKESFINTSGNFTGKPSREASRKKMTSLRKKLSQRLVTVKNETAMLTTFNEANMKPVMDMRKKHQKKFMEKHGIKLGFMSFFTKAASLALELFPQVNSIIDEEEIVTFHYADIGMAVQTEKGLMVPVIRNTETMGLAELEKSIAEIAEKARKFRISMDEMSGGTFSITNGGIFGSMLSTPILNPPQAAILGMHNIVERPVAIDGKVEVRPIMYLALTYDHRLIDGKDSVQFLYTIKDLIENPYKMLLKGTDPEKALLEL